MKKAMPDIDENGTAFCPECGYPVGFLALMKSHNTSCPNCGQFIDWRNRMKEYITFGQALEELKAGKRAARKGWNGKGMYIYMTPASAVPRRNLRSETEEALSELMGPTVTFNAHIDMKAADGTVVIGWLASQTDMLADDWYIVE